MFPREGFHTPPHLTLPYITVYTWQMIIVDLDLLHLVLVDVFLVLEREVRLAGRFQDTNVFGSTPLLRFP